ncbi:hypothetical protein IT418_02395, partial [bacterium]|nr:hypothetical protein [bacterium]
KIVLLKELIDWSVDHKSFEKFVEIVTQYETGVGGGACPTDEYFDFIDTCFKYALLTEEFVKEVFTKINRDCVDEFFKKKNNSAPTRETKLQIAFDEFKKESLVETNGPGVLMVVFTQVYSPKMRNTSAPYTFGALGFRGNKKEILLPFNTRGVAKNQLQSKLDSSIEEFHRKFKEDPVRIELVVIPKDMFLNTTLYGSNYANFIAQKVYRSLSVTLRGPISREVKERFSQIKENSYGIDGFYHVDSVTDFRNRVPEIRNELNYKSLVYIPFSSGKEKLDDLVDFLEFLTVNCKIPVILLVREANKINRSLETFFNYLLACCPDGKIDFLKAVIRMRYDGQMDNSDWVTIELLSYEDLYEDKIVSFINSEFYIRTADQNIAKVRSRARI